jgi:HK97 family phage prohead protease
MPRHEQVRVFTDLAPLQVREADGGGLTVEGVVVPFDRPTPITERQASGRVVSYREVFRRGAFADAVRVPYRVTLVYGHSDSLGDRMGSGLTFDEQSDGLVGTFRLDASQAEHAREALTSSHTGFSIGFLSIAPHAGTERSGQLVERRKCALFHVAATPDPAYVGAGVGSIRTLRGDEAREAVRHQETSDLAGFLAAAKARQAELDALLVGSR